MIDSRKCLHFSDAEKIAAFDRLADCFFQQNFGTIGKSDIELILFSTLLEHLKRNNLSVDDYDISGILGITQQRVRGMKLKYQLRNPRDYDWKRELAEQAVNARYTPDDRYITVSLEEPMLFIEVQHYIEKRNGFVEYALNPKLLKMPTKEFAELMVDIGVSDNEDKALKALQQRYREEAGSEEEITKEKLVTKIKNGAPGFAKDVIVSLLSDLLSTRMI